MCVWAVGSSPSPIGTTHQHAPSWIQVAPGEVCLVTRNTTEHSEHTALAALWGIGFI